MFKQMYIYIKLAEESKSKHPTDLIKQLIDLAAKNEEGYCYWGYNEKTGLNSNLYQEIKKNQSRLEVLFFIDSHYEGFNRVYCVADIIDFECYPEKQYAKYRQWQVKNSKTGDYTKNKYWYKLSNFKILKTKEEYEEYDLKNFYYERQTSQKKGLNEEINLRDKIDGPYGWRNGTLRVYKYVKERTLDLKVELMNEIILQQELVEHDLKDVVHSSYTNQPKPKGDKGIISDVKSFERDAKVALNALKLANYCCELNPKHKTFNRKKDGLPYTEAHHLIPMKFSDDFEYSLDIEENVISLCSHCHNQIHYGEDWEEILKALYNQRKEMLELVGLKVSYEKLKEYYN